MKLFRLLPLFLFLLGYAALGVVGTRTQMVFQWPSYVAFGLAGVGAVFLFGKRRAASPSAWCVGSMLALATYVVVRASLSPVPYFARMDLAMVISSVIVYLLFAFVFPRSRYRLMFVGLLMVLCVANVLVAVYQLMRDPTFKILPGYDRGHWEAVGGLFDNHNHLGGFLIFGLAFAMALAAFGRMGQNMRVLVLFLIPVSIFGIAITASRGALLSCAVVLLAMVMLGLYLAKSLYRYDFKKIVIVCTTAMVLLLVPAVIFGSKALAKRGGVGGSDGKLENLALGSNVRFTNWSLAYDQFLDYPVFGQGARMYDIYSVKHWPGSMNWVRADPEFAHNDYLQMLGEYGVVGLLLLMFFIIVHVLAGFRFLRWYWHNGIEKTGSSTSLELALCLGSLLILSGYAVHSVLDFNLHLPANLLPVVFAFAILSNPSARSWGRRSKPGTIGILGRVILPLSGVALLAGGWAYGRSELHVERARRVGFSDYPTVIAHLDKALARDAGNFYSHQMKGVALMYFGFDFDIDLVRAGFMSRAAKSFENALETNPYDLFSIVGLARCLGETGEHERAEGLFEKAISLGPWRREPHQRYGDYLLARGVEVAGTNFEQGVDYFERAKEEYEASRNANDKIILSQDPEYQSLVSAKRFLAIVYEEHGHRLIKAANGVRESGTREEEIAHLRSAEDYFRRAQAEGARTPTIGPALKEVTERLGK